VLTENGRFFLPAPGTLAPTTDILKPVPPGFEHLDRNEHFCLCLANCIGLQVAQSSLVAFDGQRALLVARYDRQRTDTGIQRLHQEDFCQALGFTEKYEERGGPGFETCARVLLDPIMGDDGNRIHARDDFIRCAVFNYIIGNCDAHGKNFSLLYSPSGKAKLAPFYDLVSTRAYPDLDQKYAMVIGKTFRFDRTAGHSWREFAKTIYIRPEKLLDILDETAGRIARATEQVINEHTLEHGPSPVYEKLTAVIQTGLERTAKSAEMLKASARSAGTSIQPEEDEESGPSP